MKGLFSAIGFLTIVPIKNRIITPMTIACFPLVGLFLGGILILLNFIFSHFLLLSHDITTILLLVFYIILTGGLHLDGLSDTVDGIVGGAGNKTKILRIMSDSHTGAEGVIAIVCDILLKFVLLSDIPPKNFQNVLLIFPLISRSCMVLSMYLSNPAKDSGVGKLFIENTNLSNFIIATLLSIIISLIIFPAIIIIIIIAISGFVTICITKFFALKIGGMTGDSIGTINEITEITSVLLFGIIYRKLS
ncbi:MAG: adenosylcobinamide-GDP ribazoletransferase [Elusimicrobiota bacterium]|nr:adenosylcobinamide-GDP ribazoletransferase [Elusimicrobiota bacterium]